MPLLVVLMSSGEFIICRNQEQTDYLSSLGVLLWCMEGNWNFSLSNISNPGMALKLKNMFVGPFTLAKTKIQKTWVFCCTVYTARKSHSIRGFWHEKRMREKTWISYLCVLVSGAHARLLSTFDRTCVVRITSWAAVGWFRWRSRTTWPKTRIIPARLERAFTLAKNQWNFGGVSKNHAAEVGFSIRVLWSV